MSPDGSDQGVYFDYLFALAPSSSGGNDGLNTANRCFVYDPDVSTGTDSTLSEKTSSAIATVSDKVALAALATAIIFQG